MGLESMCDGAQSPEVALTDHSPAGPRPENAGSYSPQLPRRRRTVYHNMQKMLKSLCHKAGFEYAEVLVPTEDTSVLCQSPVKYCENEMMLEFWEASKLFTFPMDVGLPGKVWARSALAFYEDVQRLPGIFLRIDGARKAGLRGCIAVPLETKDGLDNYVVLFFSTKRCTSEAIQSFIKQMESHFGTGDDQVNLQVSGQ